MNVSRESLLVVEKNVQNKNTGALLVDTLAKAVPSLLIIASLDESTRLLLPSNSWLAITRTIHGYVFIFDVAAKDEKYWIKRLSRLFFLYPWLSKNGLLLLRKSEGTNQRLWEWMNGWMNEGLNEKLRKCFFFSLLKQALLEQKMCHTQI